MQHWKHLSCVLRGISVELKLWSQHHQHNTSYATPSTQHHQHNTISTSSPTQHDQHNTIYASPSTHHYPHSIINTSSSTQHHQHNTISTTSLNITPSTQRLHNVINTTPSTQYHLHNIINTTPSTLHHHILAGAALGALPSYPFCLIPADTPLVILRGGFFSVLFSFTYSTLACPKTLLACRVIRFLILD